MCYPSKPTILEGHVQVIWVVGGGFMTYLQNIPKGFIMAIVVSSRLDALIRKNVHLKQCDGCHMGIGSRVATKLVSEFHFYTLSNLYDSAWILYD